MRRRIQFLSQGLTFSASEDSYSFQSAISLERVERFLNDVLSEKYFGLSKKGQKGNSWYSRKNIRRNVRRSCILAKFHNNFKIRKNLKWFYFHAYFNKLKKSIFFRIMNFQFCCKINLWLWTAGVAFSSESFFVFFV